MTFLSIIDTLTGAESSAKILISALLAILFLQSGIDKVTDWKGNLGWLTGHFGNSPLKNMVPLLLGTITIFEIASGVLSAVGIVFLFTSDDATFALYGAQLSALSIIMLFFGQRIAKDYPGAASLVPYFLVCIAGIMILG